MRVQWVPHLAARLSTSPVCHLYVYSFTMLLSDTEAISIRTLRHAAFEGVHIELINGELCWLLAASFHVIMTYRKRDCEQA